MEDEIAHDQKPSVKLLHDHCTKIMAKLGGMEEMKIKNTAMKRMLVKLDM